MPILFACDHCQRAYELPDTAAGRQAKCECGEMLTVPPETPPQHAAPPAPSDDAPPTPPAAGQAASGQGDAEKAGLNAPSIEASRQAPPPIPPVVGHPIGETLALDPTPSDPSAPRYRKLRQYTAELRSQANRLYWFACFITVILLANCVYFRSNSVNQNVLLGLVALLVAALAWSSAYAAALLLKATADFLQVAMDVEENTRRTEENTRR